MVRQWWTKEPTANIATPTNWCLLLDVDPRHEGDETSCALERAYGALPETPATPGEETSVHPGHRAPCGSTHRCGRYAVEVGARGMGAMKSPCPMAGHEYIDARLFVLWLYGPAPGGGCTCPRGAACPATGKPPVGTWREYQKRPRRHDELDALARATPAGNVGMVTGVVSGRLVLDVDSRNGGDETLHELDAAGHRTPDDGQVVTTSSGWLHHHLRLDVGLPCTSPWQGLDVRADGGLVVMPPSRHRSGRRYAWGRGLDWPLRTAPAWILATAHAYLARSERPPGDRLELPPGSLGISDNLVGELVRDVLDALGFEHRWSS